MNDNERERREYLRALLQLGDDGGRWVDIDDVDLNPSDLNEPPDQSESI